MKIEKSKILKKYILLKIWSEEWKKGQKINSAKELSIKFSLQILIVKKILSNLVVSNILTSKFRKGYFVNEYIFNYLPLSIRKKYNVKLIKASFKKLRFKNKLIKEYGFKNNKKCMWIETTFSNKILFNEKLLKEKTFMSNLAKNKIIISKILSKKSSRIINNNLFIVDKRKLFDIDHKITIFETLYIKAVFWFGNSKFDI